MFHYRSDFATLREEIRQYTLTNPPNTPSGSGPRPGPGPGPAPIPAEASPLPCPSHPIRGNVHALEQLQYRQSRINYQKAQRKKPPVKQYTVETFTNSSALEAHLAVAQYRKQWFRLNERQQRTKLQEYFQSHPSLASPSEVSHIIPFLLDKKNRKHIQYDKQEGRIFEIVNVKKIPYLKNQKLEQ